MAAWALALAALLAAGAAPDRPNVLFLTADTLRASVGRMVTRKFFR